MWNAKFPTHEDMTELHETQQRIAILLSNEKRPRSMNWEFILVGSLIFCKLEIEFALTLHHLQGNYMDALKCVISSASIRHIIVKLARNIFIKNKK